MMVNARAWIGLLSLCMLAGLAGCKQSENVPLSYDPPGSTVTTDKETAPQNRRTIGFEEAGVWLSNEFEGARLNEVHQVNDSTYRVVIRPENAPVNNSAWYAFKVWADREKTIRLQLTYEDGTHRYVPKLSPDGDTWRRLDAASYQPDTSDGTATLRLDVGPDTLWVAAQELITSSDFARWTDRMAQKPWVEKRVIGRSAEGQPLTLLEISEAGPQAGVVLVISRQHPPEVTGTIAALTFLETIAADTELARSFRKQFKVAAVPLMNPDGVDRGHWRHNAHGVDLNRDWHSFNQPEVQAVRDAFLKIKRDPQQEVYFAIDFHSTHRDVFYTLLRDLETSPEGFIDEWLDKIRAALPHYRVNDAPSGLGSPVSKNWFYETFDIPALTYEVGDTTERTRIRAVAEAAARATMELLLDEVAQPAPASEGR